MDLQEKKKKFERSVLSYEKFLLQYNDVQNISIKKRIDAIKKLSLQIFELRFERSSSISLAELNEKKFNTNNKQKLEENKFEENKFEEKKKKYEEKKSEDIKKINNENNQEIRNRPWENKRQFDDNNYNTNLRSMFKREPIVISRNDNNIEQNDKIIIEKDNNKHIAMNVLHRNPWDSVDRIFGNDNEKKYTIIDLIKQRELEKRELEKQRENEYENQIEKNYEKRNLDAEIERKKEKLKELEKQREKEKQKELEKKEIEKQKKKIIENNESENEIIIDNNQDLEFKNILAALREKPSSDNNRFIQLMNEKEDDKPYYVHSYTEQSSNNNLFNQKKSNDKLLKSSDFKTRDTFHYHDHIIIPTSKRFSTILNNNRYY